MNESSFVVEDGSGIVEANSYVSVESANEYYTLRAYTDWASFPLTTKQAALVQASLYIDTQYDWRGITEFEDQGLNFPRTGITSPRGEAVTGVPNAIKRATLELGKKIVTVSGENFIITELISYDGASNRIKKARSKFDVAEEEIIYMTPAETGEVRAFPGIDAMIPKYLLKLKETADVIITSILHPPLV